MVEATRQSMNDPNKFKFCYILRGLPGCGKSTVAKQLAGTNGVILDLDKNVNMKSLVAGGV